MPNLGRSRHIAVYVGSQPRSLKVIGSDAIATHSRVYKLLAYFVPFPRYAAVLPLSVSYLYFTPPLRVLPSVFCNRLRKLQPCMDLSDGKTRSSADVDKPARRG